MCRPGILEIVSKAGFRNTGNMRSFILIFAIMAVSLAIRVDVSIFGGSGIRMVIHDEPGMTLAAVHYSVNSLLTKVQAGKWNYDIRSKSGATWVHENSNVNLKNGDVVSYWVYVVKNGHGEQLLGQSWTARGASGTGSSTGNTGSQSTAGSSSGSGSSVSSGNLKLVLDDDFDGALDKSKWKHEITLSGGGNWEFQAYTPLEQNTYIKDGKLYILPTLTADKYGEAFLTTGKWDMKTYYGECTSDAFWGCKREGKDGFLNPAMSGKLMSRTAIKYGRVEIKAKMPRGDWLWPALWMLPQDWVYGGWPKSGEIDIMEAIGNRNFGTRGIQYMGSTLHWGNDQVNRFSMTHGSVKVPTVTLADGMHTYLFDWDENGMQFYLNGHQVLNVPTPSQGFFAWGNIPGAKIWPNRNSPFDQKFYLILNVAVGGTNGFIPDNVPNEGYPKPWSNQDHNAPYKFWRAKNQWLPTWKGEDAAMQVESVKMWQKV